MSEFSNTQKDFLEKLFLKLNTTIDEKTSKIQLEIEQKIEEIKIEITKNYNNLETKVVVIEEQNVILKNSALNVERKIRKNNLAIFGIGEDKTDLMRSVCDIFKNILGLKIEAGDINNVYRINSHKNKTTPVIVEFISYQNKLAVLKNVKKLKGSSIYITNDQCIDDQNRNKVLIRHLKEARNKGIVAYIKGGKLFISNNQYTVEELEKGVISKEKEVTQKGNTENSFQNFQSTSSHDLEKKNLKQLNVAENKNRQSSIKTRSNSASSK